MFGQYEHFYKFAAEQCQDPYPKERFRLEALRLLGVLEDRLSNREYILGPKYTIADIAIFPWVATLKRLFEEAEQLAMAEFKKVEAWLKICQERPATERGHLV